MTGRTNRALSASLLVPLGCGLAILVRAAAPHAWIDSWDWIPSLLLACLPLVHLAVSLTLMPARRRPA